MRKPIFSKLSLPSQYSYFLRAVLLFVCYFVTGTIGLTLDAVSGFATLVWLPTGISLAALLLFGFKYWPSILIAAFLVNLIKGAPPLVAGGIAIGNTLEAFLGAYFLKKFVGFNTSLNRLKDAIGLVLFGAILSTSVSATIGVLSLFMAGILHFSSIHTTWLAWWVGDAVSNIIIAPFLLTVKDLPIINKNYKRFTEKIFVLFLIILIGLFVFGRFLEPKFTSSPLTYIVYPPLIWAALRFSVSEISLMILVISMLAIWGTIQGFGPFALEPLSRSFLFLQSFMGIISVSIIMLASAVTERKRLEKAKDEFFSIASHELRTPLTTIRGYTQFMRRKFTKEEKKDAYYITQLDAQVERLTSLVNQMLDISRITEGRLVYSKEKFSLDSLIQNTVKDFQYASQKHTVEKIGKIRKKVFGDPDRIEQVIINLIDNAIKYSPNGNRIVISLQERQENALVGVRDYGIGIPKNKQKQIFERLFRVHEKVQKHDAGFGLGLYISAQIIKDHQGRLWVESKFGKGSTFYFTVPFQ